MEKRSDDPDNRARDKCQARRLEFVLGPLLLAVRNTLFNGASFSFPIYQMRTVEILTSLNFEGYWDNALTVTWNFWVFEKTLQDL